MLGWKLVLYTIFIFIILDSLLEFLQHGCLGVRLEVNFIHNFYFHYFGFSIGISAHDFTLRITLHSTLQFAHDFHVVG